MISLSTLRRLIIWDAPAPHSTTAKSLPMYDQNRTKAGPPVLFLHYCCTVSVLISIEIV